MTRLTHECDWILGEQSHSNRNNGTEEQTVRCFNPWRSLSVTTWLIAVPITTGSTRTVGLSYCITHSDTHIQIHCSKMQQIAWLPWDCCCLTVIPSLITTLATTAAPTHMDRHRNKCNCGIHKQNLHMSVWMTCIGRVDGMHAKHRHATYIEEDRFWGRFPCKAPIGLRWAALAYPAQELEKLAAVYT